MKEAGPIRVIDLFPGIHSELIRLLSELGPDDWKRPTVCALWSVKDIALHLLDGDIRRLSIARDKHVLPANRDLSDWNELVSFLNELNAAWVTAARRMSPRVLIQFLEVTGREVCDYFKRLDPMGQDGFPVRWATESATPNWLDIARDYTEKWHHQQQIRDAVNRPGLTDRKFFAPVLDTFVRALPYTFRNVVSSDGTIVKVTIGGEAGDDWFLMRTRDRWLLGKDADHEPASSVVLDQDTAWRLFTKGISKDQALKKAGLSGDRLLGDRVLDMISVMA